MNRNQWFYLIFGLFGVVICIASAERIHSDRKHKQAVQLAYYDGYHGRNGVIMMESLGDLCMAAVKQYGEMGEPTLAAETKKTCPEFYEKAKAFLPKVNGMGQPVS